MATRITIKGQVTIPHLVREALQLAPGDSVEFEANDSGEFVLHKAIALAPGKPRAEPRRGRRVDSQARRAEQLLALLRRLD
jgi:AbrB family looped-hinge helix DNA binding protein